MPSPVAQLKSVTKRFGAAPPVLDDLSLTANPGDFISIIGPSGCGKSTLLRLLSGLTPASSGDINVLGHPPGETDRLAYVFQEPTLLPWLDVNGNVEALLRLRNLPGTEITTRREQALQLVRLTDRAHHYPRQLSGGQKMRVSLARALTLQPDLLLLDEPFGALDEMTRDHLNEELLTIRDQQNWTAFFVTHSVAEAVFLSTRILILAPHPGRIVAEIAVDFSHPRTDELRRTDAYLRLVAEVSRQLRAVEPANATP